MKKKFVIGLTAGIVIDLSLMAVLPKLSTGNSMLMGFVVGSLAMALAIKFVK